MSNFTEQDELYKLQLHEEYPITSGLSVLRVIDGFIYIIEGETGLTSCFVPDKRIL